jgi:hypothetical protein
MAIIVHKTIFARFSENRAKEPCNPCTSPPRRARFARVYWQVLIGPCQNKPVQRPVQPCTGLATDVLRPVQGSYVLSGFGGRA